MINLSKHGKNLTKHARAKSVFYDDYARVIFDEEHSKNEERFIILGISKYSRILIVIVKFTRLLG